MLFKKISLPESPADESTTTPITATTLSTTTTLNVAFQRALIKQKLLFAEKQDEALSEPGPIEPKILEEKSKLKRTISILPSTAEPAKTELNHKRLISKLQELVVTANQDEIVNDAVEFDLDFRTAQK